MSRSVPRPLAAVAAVLAVATPLALVAWLLNRPAPPVPPRASVPPAARPAVAPADDEGLIATGRYVYEHNCLVCHGRFGDGRGEMSLGMFPKPRKFAAGIFKYRSTPAGRMPTDADLDRVVRTGLANTSMPSFAHLPDGEIRAVIAYVKTFSSRWTKPAFLGEAVPVMVPDWLSDPAQSAPHAAAGGQLFATLCVSCHGAAGKGDGPNAATLEDQWGDPTAPADLTSPLLRCGVEPAAVYRVVLTGIDGSPMPAFEAATTEAERWDLVAYLESLRRR